jgi:hypothetical protein
MNRSPLIWAFVTVGVLVVMPFYPAGAADPFWVGDMTALSLISALLWLLLTTKERRRNWFHPTIIFSLSYLIVYFQVPLLKAQGIDVSGYLVPFSAEINFGAGLALLGLCSFYFGYSCSRAYHFRPSITARAPVIYSDRGLKRVSSVLLAICVTVYLVFIALAGTDLLLAFVYDGGLSWGAGASYANVLLGIFTGMLVAVESTRICYSRVTSLVSFFGKYDKRVLAFVIASNLHNFVIGERGTVIAVSLGVMAPYFLFFKPLRARSFLAILVLAAITLTFLGASRTRDSSLSIEQRTDNGIRAVAGLSTSPEDWPSMELAGSYRVFNTALGIVPEKYDYARGRFVLGQLAAVIPFYYRFVPLDPDTYIGSSSLFFTNYLRKGNLESGEGSSVLGAIYLDFGAVGIPAVMFLLGWFVSYVARKIELVHNENSVFWMYTYIYMMFQVLKLPRSDPFFWVQNVVWGALIFFFLVKPLIVQFRGFQRVRD